MFILLCEFSIISKYDEMNFFTMYSKVQILVIVNNHESCVLMNGKVKCIDNQGKMYACEVQICWYRSVKYYTIIKFHFYQIAIHATCPLIFTTYKYSELQVSSTTQKLSCKASCKTPFFFIM
jgi:hypothetical protein